MKSSKYNSFLNIIRIFSLFCVLLYHLNILKGGFLAVNIFFTLSGYLTISSALNKEKFTIKDFYKSKFLRIYLPLFVIIFVSIDLINIFTPSLLWFNLKPETNSLLLLYNNYWQINANLDYFSKFTSSPFMHLWYVAIIMQFYLIFPFAYKLFEKLKNKKGIKIIIIILSLLTLSSTCLFIYYFYFQNLMFAYYSFEARVYSLLLGVLLGLVHRYYGNNFKLFKNDYFNKFVFYFYLLILLVMMIFISSNNKFLYLPMIITSFITLRLISYAKIFQNKDNKILKSIGNVSYEIYLLQYPVIYLFSDCNINGIIKILLIIIIIFSLAYFIHYALLITSKYGNKILSIFLSLFSLASVIGGLIIYINAEDYSQEMNALKEELAINKEKFSQMEKEYYENFKKEQENYNTLLDSYEKTDEELSQIVSSLPIVFIGDSVMLGAISNLKETFLNSYIDAEISRTCYAANKIIYNLSSENMLGDIVIIHMGTNGDCGSKTRENIMKTLEDKEVFWITVTNDKSVGVNDKLKTFSENYTNMHIIDWESYSKEHEDYFYSDGIHLKPEGRVAYTKMIYDEVFNLYKNKQEENKTKLVFEYENNQKNKIVFYGNDLLLNTYNELKKNFDNVSFNVDKDYTIDLIKEDLINNGVTSKTVIMLDNLEDYNKNDIKKISNLTGENELYIVNLSGDSNLKNVKNVIDFSKEIKNNPDYLLADNIHLSNKGNQALIKVLKETLN